MLHLVRIVPTHAASPPESKATINNGDLTCVGRVLIDLKATPA